MQIFQHKDLYDFVEIVNGCFIQIFFIVIHGMPDFRERRCYQMQNWNT